MRKILFLTDFYYPKPLANGVCVARLSEELVKDGNIVDIVSYRKINEGFQESINGTNVYRIRPRLFYYLREYGEDNINKKRGKAVFKIAMLINKIKKLIYLPLYPMTSIIFLLRYYFFIRKLQKENFYDTVISVYNPFEAVLIGLLLKIRNKEIKWIIYTLDTLSNSKPIPLFSSKFIDKKGWLWEKRFYKYADKILNLKCHEFHYSQERYNIYREKMEIVDVPLLVFNESKVNNSKNFKYQNWVYTGTLDLSLRNPEYLCEVFSRLNSEEAKSLNFYTRGNAEEIIQLYTHKLESRIFRHGYKTKKEIDKIIDESDILVSIGNAKSDMIPSKIFEYMATGKKIIHFYKQDKDSVIPYLTKYDNSILIDERDMIDVNIEKIRDFIKLKTKEINNKQLTEIFEANTPQYTAKKL